MSELRLPADVTASGVDSESSTDGHVLTSDGQGAAAWEAGGGGGTDVTLAGQDYLTLSSQEITANKLNIDDLADGTDGELITWSATGVADTVAVGTSGHVLTSNGVGVAPTFQVAGAASEINDLSAIVTWANVPDANITQTSVTQHEAALDHDALTNFDANEHADITATVGVTGLWEFEASGLGGLTNYDIEIGDCDGTPTYGIARFGDSVMGRTSYNVGNNDYDGAVVFRNVGGPVTSQVEFVFSESGNTTRFAIAGSGVGNATWSPRSILLAGPDPSDSSAVTVGYWQGTGIFGNLACDTSGSGADLGVQNDFEVEGTIYGDTIAESTAAAGVTIDGLLIQDSGIPEAAVTAHEGALTIAETQITDGSLYGRLAAAEPVAGEWAFNGGMTVEGGTLGTPGIRFVGDLTTGIYQFPGEIDLAISGTNTARFQTTGVTLFTSVTLNGAATDLTVGRNIIVVGTVDGVDIASRDHDSVTVAGQDYLTLSGQQITANKLNIDDLADGTDGELITWSATGVATTVAVGTSGHVLTSNGVGAAPTFQAAAGGGGGVTPNPGAFELSGSHNITTTESTIPFDTEVFDPDSNYSNSSGEITVTEAGYYSVAVNVPINDDGTGGATRGRVFGFLQKDASTSTWTTVNHIRGQVYEREASGGTGFHAGGIVSLVANEVIRFRVDVSSSVDVSTESGEASLNIHKIRDA